MATYKQQCTEEFYGKEEEEEQEEQEYTEIGELDTESYDSDDSQEDPTFDILQKAEAKFSKLSIKKKSKVRIAKDMDMSCGVDIDEAEIVVPALDEEDEKSFEKVQKMIEAGQLEKLKVDQCKVYLRKKGLRLTGNKDTLIQRIKDHQEILNGGGEKKYPVSSFVLNCKGDACTGDIVMFEQNVYEMFNIASRSASGPPCGTRIIAGRIVKESYGAAKQQHTFTIEVLWSKGEKQLPPLHPLLIKGRNLYRLKTLRQRWEDEGERQKALMEKHSRGSIARSRRETRIEEKEMRKSLKGTRVPRKEELKSNQPQLNPVKSGDPRKPAVQFHQNQTQNNHQNQTCKVQHSKPTIPTFQSHPNLTERWSSGTRNKNINVPQSSIEFLSSSRTEKPCISIQEVKRQRGDEFYANIKRPNSPPNHHPSLFNSCPNASGLSDRTHHRQPLTNKNHYPAVIPTQRPPLRSLSHHPWQRQGYTQQQPCRHYAQGRCYFGDNCKFLHELRDERGQRRENRW